MRIGAIATAVVAVLFGIIGSATVADRTNSLGHAGDAAAQLTRLEAVRTAVVEADSLAASAYLSGGLEPPGRRETYEARLASAQSGLVDVSGSATANESVALGGVGSALTTASGLVEQARANSRQGFPVGAAYQRQASALVRSDVLPALDEIAAATATRTTDEVEGGTASQLYLWLAGLAALAALALGTVWLSGLTKRTVNIGLAIATLTVFGFTAFASSVMASSGSTANDTVKGPYAAATAFAQARTAAFDAKSNEALTLIARGNGAAFEERWVEQADEATRQLDIAAGLDPSAGRDAADAWASYRADHEAIRAFDDEGKYDEAVVAALAIGATDDGTAAPDGFATFDTESRSGLEVAAITVNSRLADADEALAIHRWLILFAGLFAAGAAYGGFTRRIQEYR